MNGDRTVCVVLDPHFGNQLKELAQVAPLWVIDSPENRVAWENTKPFGNSALFKSSALASPEETLLGVLPDVEDHFGSNSTGEAFSCLRVIGLQLTEALAASLEERGFCNFTPVDDGFAAAVLRT